MARSIILPDILFDSDHLGAATSVNAAGTASRDPSTGRELDQPEPVVGPSGGLVPVALGTPEADVDLDLLLRAPGNADGARWAWRNYGTGTWKAKSPAGVTTGWRWLHTTTTGSAARFSPKALPLESGELLAFYVTGTLRAGAGWQSWDTSNGWSGLTALSTGIGYVIGVDAVQFPDTLETVAFVAGCPSSGATTQFLLERWTTSNPDNFFNSTTAFKPSVVRYDRAQTFVNLRSMAVEILPWAGGYRVAMLVHDQHGSLWRTYSDDRGVTWAPFAKAGTYHFGINFSGSIAHDPTDNAAWVNVPGGVAVCRARTGSIVACAPALGMVANDSGIPTDPTTAASLAPPNTHDIWTTAQTPVVRMLVSDDGDTYAEVVEDAIGYGAANPNWGGTSPVTSHFFQDGDSAPPAVQNNGDVNARAEGSNDRLLSEGHLFSEGCNEGALVCGDDGLVRFYGALHGDSDAVLGSSIYDDLTLLTLKKPDITAASVGRRVGTLDTAVFASLRGPSTPNGTRIFTVPEAVDCPWVPRAGAFVANQDAVGRFQGLTPRRIGATHAGAASANGSGNLDATPAYGGVRQVEAVNFRGAIWLLVCGEDTGEPRYSVACARAAEWSEMFELLPENHALASQVFGRAYEEGWVPVAKPSRQGFTLTGTAGNVTYNNLGTDGGVRIANADNVATYFSVTGLLGTAGKPWQMTFSLVPGTGGDLATDNIALSFVLRSSTGGSNYVSITIPFTTTSFAVVDVNDSNADKGSATGLALTHGIEVKVMHDGATALTVLYRVLAEDPESNGAWTSLIAAATIVATTGSAESVTWGNQTTTSCVSSWRSVQWGRARSGNSTLAKAQLNALQDGSSYPEFQDDPIGPYQCVVGYDDGTRHGSRAPVCAAEPAAWIKRGARARWLGAAGMADPASYSSYSHQDRWRVRGTNEFAPKRALVAPVSDVWRSADDSAASYLLFDAGADGMWRPDSVAFFRCNAETLVVEFAATNSWSGALAVQCDTTDDGDVRRDVWRRTCAPLEGSPTFTVEGAGNNVVRMIPVTGDPSGNQMTPHQFRSDDRVAWYLYSSALNASARILDNDGLRITLDTAYAHSDFTGANADNSTDYVAVYCDRVAFALAGGSLATTGYRWMRVTFGRPSTTEDLAEGYQQCGLLVAGRRVPLDDPHPDWGWQRKAIRVADTTDNQQGYVDVRENAPARWRWEFGFDMLRPVRDRANLGASPGDRAKAWERWRAAMAAMKSGEVVGALMPEYKDGLAAANMGSRSVDVYPVRFTGDAAAVQVAYEGKTCRADNQVQPFYQVQGAAFDEIL